MKERAEEAMVKMEVVREGALIDVGGGAGVAEEEEEEEEEEEDEELEPVSGEQNMSDGLDSEGGTGGGRESSDVGSSNSSSMHSTAPASSMSFIALCWKVFQREFEARVRCSFSFISSALSCARAWTSVS